MEEDRLYRPDIPIAAKIAAHMNMAQRTIMTTPIMLITNPATARPRGCLNSPIKEKSNPKNQSRQLIRGNTDMKIETRESTKPATPIPLLLRSCFSTTITLLFGGSFTTLTWNYCFYGL